MTAKVMSLGGAHEATVHVAAAVVGGSDTIPLRASTTPKVCLYLLLQLSGRRRRKAATKKRRATKSNYPPRLLQLGSNFITRRIRVDKSTFGEEIARLGKSHPDQLNALQSDARKNMYIYRCPFCAFRRHQRVR
jgi:hypothetical protein